MAINGKGLDTDIVVVFFKQQKSQPLPNNFLNIFTELEHERMLQLFIQMELLLIKYAYIPILKTKNLV